MKESLYIKTENEEQIKLIENITNRILINNKDYIERLFFNELLNTFSENYVMNIKQNINNFLYFIKILTFIGIFITNICVLSFQNELTTINDIIFASIFLTVSTINLFPYLFYLSVLLYFKFKYYKQTNYVYYINKHNEIVYKFTENKLNPKHYTNIRYGKIINTINFYNLESEGAGHFSLFKNDFEKLFKNYDGYNNILIMHNNKGEYYVFHKNNENYNKSKIII